MEQNKYDLVPQISYRFFNKADNKMYDVDKVEYDTAGNIVKAYIGDTLADIANGSLVQSTGIFAGEKQEAEIYEGDLVSLSLYDNLYSLLVFWDCGWRVLGLSSQEFGELARKEGAIVGNMYQNPTMVDRYKENVSELYKHVKEDSQTQA